jgi:hypothetical protein
LHKAASEVRYKVIFNNGSTTEPNGVSELSLAPHGVAVFTTKHSPAEIARNKSRVAVGCALVSPALAAGLPLAVAEQDHQFHGAKKFERKCCLLVTWLPAHAQKSRARRVLVAFKRANISCFGPHDRAAAPAPQIYRIYIGLFFLRFVNGNRVLLCLKHEVFE